MSSPISPAHGNCDPQRLLERISELEQDLRNSRRLHQTIERNNRLFEALLASSRDGIALTRLDGVVIRVIRSVAGWEPSEIAGMSLFSLIHPEDAGRLRECYQQIAEKRAVKIDHDVRLLKPDGTSVRVSGTVTDMLDDPAVQAIVHNYRRAVDAVASDLSTAIAVAPFAAFCKRTNGEILTWNLGAREMFGYEADEIIGCSVSILVPPDRSEEERQCRALAVTRGAALARIRTERVCKDGARIPIALVLSPLVSGGQVIALAHLSYPLQRPPTGSRVPAGPLPPSGVCPAE